MATEKMMNQDIQIQEFNLTVPGGHLHIKTWAPASHESSEPVLLFHDSLGCVEMWRTFPLELCRTLNRTIIAYDRLGFGRSSARSSLPSVRFVHEEAEQSFPELVSQLKLKRLHLFGHSVGGSMALACAALHPEVCDSVVTESSQVFVEQRTLEGILKAKALFSDPAQLEKLKKFHGEKAQWVLNAWTEVWLSSEFRAWSLADVLKDVRCSVLAIHGDRDEYGSVEFPQMICDLSQGPSSLTIIQNCGHVPHREYPEMVCKALADFYQSR